MIPANTAGTSGSTMIDDLRSYPHRIIVSVTGNTFGSGDELARDILSSLDNAGLAIVPENLLDAHQARYNLLREDLAICHHSRYGMECLLGYGHDGIHRQ